MTNKPLKTISTGTLVALGLSINTLYSTAQGQSTFETKSVPSLAHAGHKHKPEHKMKEGACGMQMQMDSSGMVMHENKDTLPKDCKEISEDITIKVIAGVKFAEAFPGTVFGFDKHQWEAKPCSRITIEFSNDDDIRHQWMIHGLPQYLYPQGMFHIEVNGQGKKSGTFIVPSHSFNYLVHCDIAQHMEKGMKAQLKVGKGGKKGDLPSIPGISDPKFPDLF